MPCWYGIGGRAMNDLNENYEKQNRLTEEKSPDFDKDGLFSKEATRLLQRLALNRGDTMNNYFAKADQFEFVGQQDIGASDKLDSSINDVVDAIKDTRSEASEWAQRTAEALQTALEKGSLEDVVKKLNDALPKTRGGDDAITLYGKGDTRQLFVHPGIGGFVLDLTKNGNSWNVKYNGENLK
jgi:hypothetical protein